MCYISGPLVFARFLLILCSLRRGFTCHGNELQTCLSTVTSGSYEVGYCPTGNISINTLTHLQPVEVPGTNVVTVDYPLSTLSSSITAATLYAPLLQINWQATDLPPMSPSVSSPSVASTTTLSPVSTTASNPSGLSSGAKIAIGITVPIAVLTSVALLAFWLLHRRSRSHVETAQLAASATTRKLQCSELNGAPPPRELEELIPEASGDRPPLPKPQELEETRPKVLGDGPAPPETHELGT